MGVEGGIIDSMIGKGPLEEVRFELKQEQE